MHWFKCYRFKCYRFTGSRHGGAETVATLHHSPIFAMIHG
jgi:hypothetical protein